MNERDEYQCMMSGFNLLLSTPYEINGKCEYVKTQEDQIKPMFLDIIRGKGRTTIEVLSLTTNSC